MSEGSGSFEVSEELRRLILKHAIANAMKHGGKASPGPVMNKILGERPELRSYARELAKVVKEVVDYINSLSQQELERIARDITPSEEGKKKEEIKGLPPLPDVDKGVVTRFAPNPDFVLHLGNARPALLSYLYAKEMYNGKMILRLEDTDPRIKTPMPEAYWAIKEDLRWLGIKWDEEYIQSLRMELYYQVAKELIKRGGAYVDLCGREEISRNRALRRACPHRSQPIEYNLELFEKMLSGFFGEGEASLRVKTDLDHQDPSVIDWIAMRIIDTSKYPHPIVGDKYIVWPTYNFAAGVDDHLMGITHIIRGREHMQNTVKQSYLYKHMGWIYPHVINVGRLKLEGFLLSKSMIRAIIEKHPDRFNRFSDPRFGTLAGLRSRGILGETIRETIYSLGVKVSDATISWDNLASLNRKKLDPTTRRLMFVADPIKLYIEGLPKELLEIEMPFHLENKDLGSRVLRVGFDKRGAYVYISKADLKTLPDSKAFRLMELANVELLSVDEESGAALARYISSGLDDAKKMGLPIIQWVPQDHLKAVLRDPVGLRYKLYKGLIEKSIISLEDSVYQLMRIGFVKVVERINDRVVMLKIHN
jgi:glutamyl-tRNA synthetase